MSVFNTRKDRDRNGNPKPHCHTGYAGFEGKMMHHDHRVVGLWPNWNASHNPSAWTRMHMNKPRRVKDAIALRKIVKGADPDELLFPHRNKPYVYYY
ncbi:hypothetical protein RJ498_003161 [Pluralibacter gergoviae]